MIEEKQKIFTSFMDEFVKLNVDQKNNEIIEKQKVILAFLLKFASERGIQFEFLKSKGIIFKDRYHILDQLDKKEPLAYYLEKIAGDRK